MHVCPVCVLGVRCSAFSAHDTPLPHYAITALPSSLLGVTTVSREILGRSSPLRSISIHVVRTGYLRTLLQPPTTHTAAKQQARQARAWKEKPAIPSRRSE
jgi:hypothetical protein